MPRLAQQGDRRGPLAALLIVLGLLLGAGPASTSSASARDAFARPGSLRQGATVSLPRSTDQSTLSEEESGADPFSFVPPVPPQIVLDGLASWPSGVDFASVNSPSGQSAAAPYRARAPPAA